MVEIAMSGWLVWMGIALIGLNSTLLVLVYRDRKRHPKAYEPDCIDLTELVAKLGIRR